MANAIISVTAVEIQCPACKECLAHPETGSQIWPTNENRFAAPFTVACPCGASVRVAFSRTLRRMSY